MDREYVVQLGSGQDATMVMLKQDSLDFKLLVSITHTACFFLFFFFFGSSHIHHQSCQLLCTSPTPSHRSLQKLQLLSITFHPFSVFSYIVAMIFLFLLLPKTRKSTANMYIYDNRFFFFWENHEIMILASQFESFLKAYCNINIIRKCRKVS